MEESHLGMATGSNFTTRVPVLNSNRVPVFKRDTSFAEHFLMYITSNIATFITTTWGRIILILFNHQTLIIKYLSMFINSRSIIFGTLEVFIALQNLINIFNEMVWEKYVNWWLILKFYKNSLQNGYPGSSLLPGYPVSKRIPG